RRHGRRRADRLDARPARQALLGPRAPGGRGTRVPPRPAGLPRLCVRPRRARTGRGREREVHGGDRARAAGGRRHPAAAVRDGARRPLPCDRQARPRQSPVRADRRDRAAAERERRQDRPGDLPLPDRPWDRTAACARTRARRARRAPVDRRRRRPRVGARTKRALRRGARILAAGAEARGPGRAQVLPPRDDRALPRPHAGKPGMAGEGAGIEPPFLGAVVARRTEARRMTKLVLLLVAVTAGALALAANALAHPVGNFTINRYSRIQPSGDRLYVLYVLDQAEIPTFQARPDVEAEGRQAYAERLARTIASRLRLTVDGRRAALVPIRHRLAFPPGQAGLRTTRLEVVLAGPHLDGRSRIAYRDTNYGGRIGWKEITVHTSGGARSLGSSVPSSSISEELLAYPRNLLQSPLDVSTARLTVVPGEGPAVAPTLLPRSVLEHRAGVRAVADGGFARLIVHDRLSVGFVLVSLLVAMFWGAAHALSPGHGKSIVAAYLVGSRGTVRHAALLGLTVTVTHTIGVFALGLVTLSLSAFVVPDHVYPWLNLVSSLLIVSVGLSVLRWRFREWRGGPAADTHDHRHGHDHDHDHGHGHHDHDPALGLRRLLGVGISGGIIPCPTALVVLLAAISLHRVGYGL